jgi:hypothetical protein
VGQVLRYRRQLSTTVFAKVDHEALRTLACPLAREPTMNTIRSHAEAYLAMRRGLGSNSPRSASG